MAEPQLTGDGSRTLHSERYGQTYHSRFGAEAESRYVFLETSGIAARLAERRKSVVLELGFGLGLNYLLTADLAVSNKTNLTYHAYEHDLISRRTFESLQYDKLLLNPSIARSVTRLLDQANDTTRTHRSSYLQFALNIADIAKSDYGLEQYDAIYLDAFSPDTNQECWTAEIFAKLWQSLSSGGILATYSVKGSVRRALEDAGFTTERLPGPTGKREILRASRP